MPARAVVMSQKLAAEIADGTVFAHNDLLSGKRCAIVLPARGGLVPVFASCVYSNCLLHICCFQVSVASFLFSSASCLLPEEVWLLYLFQVFAPRLCQALAFIIFVTIFCFQVFDSQLLSPGAVTSFCFQIFDSNMLFPRLCHNIFFFFSIFRFVFLVRFFVPTVCSLFMHFGIWQPVGKLFPDRWVRWGPYKRARRVRFVAFVFLRPVAECGVSWALSRMIR